VFSKEEEEGIGDRIFLDGEVFNIPPSTFTLDDYI
jgi:hypothetical protein